LIPLCVFIGLVIIAAFFADNVIFRPHKASYIDGPDVIKLATASGDTISAKYYPSAGAKFTILFSHGNAEDIGDIESFSHSFRDYGFNVLVYDYRGYGTSEGTPTEEKAYEDINAAYDFLTGQLKIPADQIIVHGRSLGGAVAVDLAARKTVKGLILESTFTSAFRVLTGWRILPFDKFETVEKLKLINCPVLVIHGKQDRTIHFSHGEELFRAAPGEKDSLWVDKAGHNDLVSNAPVLYMKKITQFAGKL
jgi:fermentation-respiration switch protein FrsA (DUF1100 family)